MKIPKPKKVITKNLPKKTENQIYLNQYTDNQK